MSGPAFGLHWFEVPPGAWTVDLNVRPVLVFLGMTPLIVMVTDPFANILIEPTEKLLPLLLQLPLDAEHVQVTDVFLLVEKETEAPLTLWLESPFTVIVPLYVPVDVALGGELRVTD